MERPALALALALAAGATLGTPGAARAAGDARWIHVHVSDPKDGGTRVDVNLPLSVVDVALDVARDDKLANGRLRIEHGDVSVSDLRKMWTALKQAGDRDLVTVEKEDERVVVARKGDRILVDVTGKKSGKQKVHVDLPAVVVDALFSGSSEDTLDLRAAVTELKRASLTGDLVRVEDGDAHVRVWIE